MEQSERCDAATGPEEKAAGGRQSKEIESNGIRICGQALNVIVGKLIDRCAVSKVAQLKVRFHCLVHVICCGETQAHRLDKLRNMSCSRTAPSPAKLSFALVAMSGTSFHAILLSAAPPQDHSSLFETPPGLL